MSVDAAECNRFAVLGSWVESVKGALSDPLSTAFPTISNDPTGARSYPQGSNEVQLRRRGECGEG